MFGIPLPTYLFTKKHPLRKSSKRTYIPLLISQFVSLIEPKITITCMCKFKKDKITYSKS